MKGNNKYNARWSFLCLHFSDSDRRVHKIIILHSNSTERLHWLNEIIHNLSFLVQSTLLYQFEATTGPHLEYNYFLFIVTENNVHTNFIDARKQRLCQEG